MQEDQHRNAMTEIASVLSRQPGPDDKHTVLSVLDDLNNIAELEDDFGPQAGDSSDLSGQHEPPDATVASAHPAREMSPERRNPGRHR